MDMAGQQGLEKYLERLRELPFVLAIEVRAEETSGAPRQPDAMLRLTTRHGELEYHVELKTAHPLGYHAVAPTVAAARSSGQGRWILFAPYITLQMGAHLREHGIDYLDAAGNAHIALEDRVHHHVEGRRLDPSFVKTRTRGSGAQVAFTIAARPELVSVPVRELAAHAGVTKSTASNELRRLAAAGYVVSTRRGRQLSRRAQLIDAWIDQYVRTFRPRWLQGRYRAAAKDSSVVEEAIDRALSGATWAWGGAPAERRLTSYFRGDVTTVHVAEPALELPRRVRALPAADGPIAVIVTPIPVAFEGAAPRTVHPLLVYAELLSLDDERARDAAERLRERFLGRGA
jgi:hypothetical protein